MNHHESQSYYATVAAGSGWWVLDAFMRHGPSWQLVPPILIATATACQSARSWLDGRQARRHAEERFRAEMLRFESSAPASPTVP